MAAFVVKRATDDLKKSIDYSQVWLYLALDDIFARYRNTMLGPLWNAAYIVAQALALSLVFGGVFHQPLHTLMPYILSGIAAWALGPASILECSGLLIWFSGTIKTQNFPLLFYALRLTARAGLMFLHNLIALLIVLPMFGHMPIISLTIIPAVALIMLLSVPYCLMLGMLCARFRDMQMLISNFSNVFFVISPIFWMPSNIPGARSAEFVNYNPFYYMIDIIRQPILNVIPGAQDWICCSSIAILGWMLCFGCLASYRQRVPFWV